MTRKTHLDFLCDIGELMGALADSANLDGFLHELVAAVSRQLHADVSSIYLYDREDHELVLRATVGLTADAVGSVRLDEGEGIVGAALRGQHPIVDNTASANPHYKAIPGIGEEAYQAFLAVPLLRGTEKIGVITAQREQARPFSRDDLSMLRAVGAQLAGTIENIRAIMALQAAPPSPGPVPTSMSIIRGHGMSPGWACGRVYPLDGDSSEFEPIAPPPGVEAFKEAVERTIKDIESLQSSMTEKIPEAATLVLDVHILMLKDPWFVGKMQERVNEGTPADAAIRQVTNEYATLLSRNSDAYLREKEADIRDVGRRLLANLVPGDTGNTDNMAARIVVAHELYPSDIVKLSAERVGALVLTAGGTTTHVSILARALDLPLVIADNPALHALTPATHLLVDGSAGTIYVEPDDQVRERYAESENARRAVRHRTPRPRTETADGTRIHLLANINLLTEVEVACRLNAEGIGLYRTEFPFMIRTAFPSEEEQYVIYRKLAEQAPSGLLTFRTLDVGGEKALAYYEHGHERNPALGLRSIRFSLRHPDLLTQQCKAILRAGAEREDLRIMFPMITSVDEYRKARAILDQALKDLAEGDDAYHQAPKVGVMVELPSVVPLIKTFAREAHFVSIGTNDFVQYMLATDRGSEQVADYYCPHHPAVLRALRGVLESAADTECEVSVCGEMAHQRRYLPFLIGIGCRNLSVDPHFIPPLQDAIATLDLDECESLAGQLLAAETIAETEMLLPAPEGDGGESS